MSPQVAWLAELRRLVVLVVVALAVGWPLGLPWELLSVALIVLAMRWLWQMRRLLRWLEDPAIEPPEALGFWGEMYDRLYQLQRKAREREGDLRSRLDYLQDSLSSMHDGAIMH